MTEHTINDSYHTINDSYRTINDYLAQLITQDELLRIIESESEESNRNLPGILWYVGLEIHTLNDDAKETIYLSLLHTLLERNIVNADQLKFSLESEYLEKINLFKKKHKNLCGRYNAHHVYNYIFPRFLLHSQQNEGFAALFLTLQNHEYNTDNDDDDNDNNNNDDDDNNNNISIVTLLDKLLALIGLYQIDVIRVIDIILEFLEHSSCLKEKPLMSVLKLLCHKTNNPFLLQNIVRFKYRFLSHGDSLPPASFFSLLSILLKHQIFSADTIWALLGPSEEVLQQDYIKITNYLFAQAEKKKNPVSAYTRMFGAAHEKSEKEVDVESEIIKRQLKYSKLNFIATLLERKDWPNASSLLAKCSQWNPCCNRRIRKNLLLFLHDVINPYFVHLAPKFSKVHEAEPHCETTVDLRKEKAARFFSKVANFSGFIDKVCPLLFALHFHLSRDLLAFTKTCRVAATFLKYCPHSSEENKTLLAKCVQRVLFPSLLLIPTNPACASLLWKIIKTFPFQKRYKIYATIRARSFSKYPQLLAVKNESIGAAKGLMRRIAKGNEKENGRKASQFAHHNPLIVMDIVLSQLEKYHNLIEPIVDSLTYLSKLSFDVLTFVIIDHLSTPGRNDLKEDGTTYADWLKGLALFSGFFFKSYTTCELEGLLVFLCNRLKSQKFVILLVLQSLINSIAGIEVSEDLTKDQLQARAGGNLLIKETQIKEQTQNPNKTVMSKANATKSFVNLLIESQLAIPLYVLIAQQRSAIVFKEDVFHLKLLGDLYDKCQDTLTQYAALLISTVPLERMTSLLPSVKDLMCRYNLDPDPSFHLLRPYLRALYSSKENIDKDMAAVFDSEVDTYHSLSPSIYSRFWSLSLSEIYVPKNQYEKQIDLLQAMSNLSEADKKKKVNSLKIEFEKQKKNRLSVLDRLEKEKSLWFTSTGTEKDTMLAFLQLCIFPRCTWSLEDALFCSHFVQLLISLQTPHFDSLSYFDKVLKDITFSLFCCTEKEAARMGLFLSETLMLLEKWRKNKKTFDSEFTGPEFPSYSQFLHQLQKWHIRVATSFCDCLNSDEYLEVKNALIVLSKLDGVFPVITSIFENIETCVKKVQNEERKDLKLLANGLFALLQKQRKLLVSDGDFLKEKKPIISEKAQLIHKKLLENLENDKKRKLNDKEKVGTGKVSNKKRKVKEDPVLSGKVEPSPESENKRRKIRREKEKEKEKDTKQESIRRENSIANQDVKKKQEDTEKQPRQLKRKAIRKEIEHPEKQLKRTSTEFSEENSIANQDDKKKQEDTEKQPHQLKRKATRKEIELPEEDSIANQDVKKKQEDTEKQPRQLKRKATRKEIEHPEENSIANQDVKKKQEDTEKQPRQLKRKATRKEIEHPEKQLKRTSTEFSEENSIANQDVKKKQEDTEKQPRKLKRKATRKEIEHPEKQLKRTSTEFSEENSIANQDVKKKQEDTEKQPRKLKRKATRKEIEHPEKQLKRTSTEFSEENSIANQDVKKKQEDTEKQPRQLKRKAIRKEIKHPEKQQLKRTSTDFSEQNSKLSTNKSSEGSGRKSPESKPKHTPKKNFSENQFRTENNPKYTQNRSSLESSLEDRPIIEPKSIHAPQKSSKESSSVEGDNGSKQPRKVTHKETSGTPLLPNNEDTPPTPIKLDRHIPTSSSKTNRRSEEKARPSRKKSSST